MVSAHAEKHLVHRIGWLRAAVLGANDGIVSVASIIVGVASATTDMHAVLAAGIAGLVAGAMSMAAGEFISVSSQSDTETADIARERRELAANPAGERLELAGLFEQRGLSRDLARAVADELTAKDALAAHIREELGITDVVAARPVQAALTSAATFAAGAILPLAAVFVAPEGTLIPLIVLATLIALAILGYVGARVGGAKRGRAILRVVLWGLLAMVVTAGAGWLFGVAV